MADIESILSEDRLILPPQSFSDRAHVSSAEEYQRLCERASRDPEGYWAEVAAELHWQRPWSEVLKWQRPDAEWFVGGQTNLAYNCLDRHLKERGDQVALVWEGEPGDRRSYTFRELHAQVSRAANALLSLDVKAGDRVAIYMPLIPEAAIAMLACARVGAVHSVIFAGFSAEALRERIVHCEARVVITADGGWRRGAVVPLKEAVDEACRGADVRHVVVARRCGVDIAWTEGRDHDWETLCAAHPAVHEAPALDAEHPLFVLYTSGTTGAPKGILHTTGGYMVGAYQSARLVFDLREDDVFWCTADVGWITGHTYVVYGALLNGCTTFLYEGAPDHPRPDRFWELCEAHRVTVFYTAPTAIRAFMRWGDEWPKKHDLATLRLLGSVGEPINPEAWMWYRKVIGGDRCPVVDTWWQTETGSIMIAPVPGATPAKPGSCTVPLPGISARIVDSEGRPSGANEGGYLVIDKPWPSMLRGIYGDRERFVSSYFETVEDCYFAGDGARVDADGYFWVMGRVDDVLNVSGHRLSTMEVESALVAHPQVAEAAVVARPDALKGQAIVAFVTPMKDVETSPELGEELRRHVARQIGAIARPEEIRFADALPKTRSGKIMRRLLRDLAAGRESSGDTSTLEDSAVLARLAALHGDEE